VKLSLGAGAMPKLLVDATKQVVVPVTFGFSVDATNLRTHRQSQNELTVELGGPSGRYQDRRLGDQACHCFKIN